MRFFVTGIQGLVGWNLYRHLRQRYETRGFARTRRGTPGSMWYEDLVEDYRDIRRIVRDFSPDVIIHAQAMCNLDLCEIKPDKTRQINIETTRWLLDAARPEKRRFVHLSTEHVFSGQKGRYREEDPVDPISVYGRSRADAEELVRGECTMALIIRPGLMIGPSMQKKIGLHDFLKKRLLRGAETTYFVDEIRSPISSEDLFEGVLHLILEGASGTYHVAGADRLSRYELSMALARAWGLEPLIRPASRLTDSIPRIGDCTLDSSKAARAGWRVPRLDIGRIVRTIAQGDRPAECDGLLSGAVA
ncbi:MAG: SDR family oxidoreductase [Candidatus Omnitrophica bacterium]|nr:SDR family oxidoreductase [Candidatus Omnitrophota bacterium]